MQNQTTPNPSGYGEFSVLQITRAEHGKNGPFARPHFVRGSQLPQKWKILTASLA